MSDLRKAEDNAKHNFDMLKQSLVDSIKEDNTDLTQPAADEGKAVTEGDLAVTSKDLAASENDLATVGLSACQLPLIMRQPSQPAWRSLL